MRYEEMFEENKVKLKDALNEYGRILENAIRKELKINIPDYPESINIPNRICFLERFLHVNGKAELESKLWETKGKKLCEPYFDILENMMSGKAEKRT